jgi:hypothetical protein
VDIVNKKTKAKRIKAHVRDVFAALCWCYCVVKLAIFDFDTYLISGYFPRLNPFLPYKLFFFIAFASVLWLVLGNKRFLGLVGYVLVFPGIVASWKIPKLMVQNWGAAVILAPSIYSVITTVRPLFIRITLAALATVCVFLSSNLAVLAISMSILGVVLIIHLYYAFRKAYQPTVFGRLRNGLSKYRETLVGDTVMKNLSDWAVRQHPSGTEEDKLSSKLSNLYLTHALAEYIGEKIQEVVRSRRMDMYLIISWFWTILITSLIYSLEYTALHKIIPKAFSVTYAPTYWSFLGFAFGRLTPSSISAISPASPMAIALSYSENACALAIFVILVFTILTAARERYKEDISGAVDEFLAIGSTYEKYLLSYFNMALADAEDFLVNHNLALVNAIRKLRRLPELQPPQLRS